MKKISKILLGLLLSANVMSCSDFFEVENPNTITEESFWQTESDALKGLMATYSALQHQGCIGGSTAANTPMRSDTGRPNNWNADGQALQKLSFNDNTTIVKEKWADLYTGVLRANQVIEQVPEIQMDEERKEIILAEAHFLRGVFYYWLYSTYNHGSVIIHTEVPKSKEDFTKPLSSKEKVLELILSDLEYAQQRLPETWEDDMLGRATWGAATGFLGHVHINEHKYDLAQVEYKKIIDSGLYRLTDDLTWNFDIDHEFSSESIFEVSFTTTFKGGNDAYAPDGPSGSEGTTRGVTCAPSIAGGWRVSMPSYWITMKFKQEKMNMDDPRNEDRIYSLRAEASIAMADDGTQYYQDDVDKVGGFNNGEASYMRKFQNHWDDRENPNDVISSGINERIIRLADIYLLYAECLLQTGGSTAEALSYVNMIRERSALELVPEDITSNELMEHIMWEERPLELMYEGHDTRWVDLRRWDKVQEQYDRLAQYKYFIENKVLRYATEDDWLPLQEYIEAAGNYSPEYHDYFPIPVDEVLTNPNLDTVLD